MRGDPEPAGLGAVIGLGNPGKRYEKTRHNAGFLVVEELGRRLGVPLQDRLFRGSWGTALIGGRKVLLFKPSTYMNRSGEAVAELLHYFRLEPGQMLVVHDDLDLACGRVRLARRGGSGGHKGIQSIIQHVGLQDFPRLKLGIGRPRHGESVEDFVLETPHGPEKQEFADMILTGAEIVEAVVTDGLDAAMNRFNPRPAPRTVEESPS